MQINSLWLEISSETKARLRALAERQQLSESALLRRLVELVLLKAALSPIITETRTAAAKPLRTARLMIRLRTDDQILLRDRAAARGMPPATCVSVLTRAHLRSLAPLPKDERTIGELGGIGRNLNQIAHAANQGQLGHTA
jgi:Bacterial mobilisation protein (MobC)